MSNIPTELKYSKEHEWVRIEDDGSATIGITDHAQSLLGDMVYVELPEVETDIHAGDECGVVESVKAASDVYTPLSGEVIAVNEELADSPEVVNTDPYGNGWLFKLRLHDDAQLKELLDAEAYGEHIASE